MIFSSLEFILLFLPLAVVVYNTCIYFGYNKYALLFITGASLFYYAYWKYENILIIVFSITINYIFGNIICLAREKGWKRTKLLFIFAVTVNLALLFYFKYTIFALTTWNQVTGGNLSIPEIILPIGISFFTFQQIAYLSDIYTGRHLPSSEGLLHYCLFITFFPQLIAGPIVHHKEMMPQFVNITNSHIHWKNIYCGLILFSIGLAKKVLVADMLSPLVHHAFDVERNLTFAEALLGSLCYTLQLYFDFSGYCDMAIGCALMFNISLPWNFDSPYKATTIQDFWRRWHITLSRWLRDYLYIPLGGNRKGDHRTLLNLFLTFLLGGLWHGAAWTFIIWGAMHGLALIVHRLWQRFSRPLCRPLAWAITFLFINTAWIVFRAKDMACIDRYAQAFTGQNGWLLRASFLQQMKEAFFIPDKKYMLAFIFSMLILCFCGKNSQEYIKQPDSIRTLLIASIYLSLSVFLLALPDKAKEFIYFQF